MNKSQKALIIQSLISESNPAYWGRDRVADYLRELKDRGFADIKVGFDREVRKNRIIDWIKNADPDLSLFYFKNQQSERSRKQTSELLTLPNQIIKEIEQHIQSSEEIQYDPFKAGTWQKPEIVYMTKNDGNVEIWLAHKVGRPDGEKMDWDSLPPEVQGTLASAIKKNEVESVEFQSVVLQYNIYGRIINIVTINLNTNQVSIRSDEKKYFDPDDAEEHRVNPEERFTETLQTALNSIGIEKKKEEVIDMRSIKRINKESVSNIHAIEEIDHLILPFRFDFLYDKGNTSEKTRDEFFKLTTLMLKPKVVQYYTDKGSFSGFFEKNRDLDVENNGILLKRLRDEDNIQPVGNGFFLFIAESDGKIISARIVCHIATGSMRILPDSTQTAEEYERINQELDRLFP